MLEWCDTWGALVSKFRLVVYAIRCWFIVAKRGSLGWSRVRRDTSWDWICGLGEVGEGQMIHRFGIDL